MNSTLAATATVSKRQSELRQRQKNRSLRDQINDLNTQRDAVFSRMLETDVKIHELILDLEKLRASPQLLKPSRAPWSIRWDTALTNEEVGGMGRMQAHLRCDTASRR